MYTLTTPDGRTLTAPTEAHLAYLWAAAEHGDDWDADTSAFDEHTVMNEYLDLIADLRDHPADGYVLHVR